MERFTESTHTEKYDLIVIGGGITGAAVFYALAKRGAKVALVEKNDYGWATSAATSKLIHGGLRYLKNYEFGLVRESLRERRILANIAPNFVYPLPFLIPLYTRKDIALLRNGMFLYDILSFGKNKLNDPAKRLPDYSVLSRLNVIAEEQNIRGDDLKKGVVYYDYQNFSPERMTLAFIKSGLKYGGSASNYSEVQSFIQEKQTIKGVIVRDLISGSQKKIQANICINCGGTWADEILGLMTDDKTKTRRMQRSEGVHIITQKLSNKHAITFSTKEGKHFLIVPWRNHSIIGTTDKLFTGKPDDYRVSKESIDEIIENINGYFGNGLLSYQSIKYAYGGLRPLIGDGNDSYNTSRKYEIYDNSQAGIHGLITVEGGKYTTSRNLAESVVRLVEKKQGFKFKRTSTEDTLLVSCDVGNITDYITRLKSNYPSFRDDTITFLAKQYGTEAENILKLAQTQSDLQQIVSSDGEILAEVQYVVKHESVFSLRDVLLRRTGIGTLGKPSDSVLAIVVNKMAELLDWSEARVEQEKSSLEEHYRLPVETA